MSKDKPSEEVNTRHRLVGAIVLLAAGVIIIPMLLQGNGPGSGAKKAQLKEEVKDLITDGEESKTFITRIKPVSGINQQAIKEDQITQSAPTLATVNDNEEPSQEVLQTTQIAPEITNQVAAAQPIIAKEKEPEVPAKSEKSIFKEEDVSRGWTVRIGTFSKPVNAQNLMAKLNDTGFNSRYDVIENDSGQVTRIWIGPYEKRVTAGRALEKVKQVTGLKGYIKSYP